MALCERIEIAPGESFGSLSSRLADLGGELAIEALRLHEAGDIRFEQQPAGGVTYAEKIEPEERRLDPDRPAAELARIVQALNPHVGTYLELDDGERLGVVEASAAEGESPPAGTLGADGDALALGTAAGTLRIHTVRPAGKREMAAADYLRGNPAPRLRA